MKEIKTFNICDTGDNYPIHFSICSESDGFHLIEFRCKTFDEKITFSYRILLEVIKALQLLLETEEANDEQIR